MSVNQDLERLLESCDCTDLIPTFSVAEIETCEVAASYSPEGMQMQILQSSGTEVDVSYLRMIIANAKEMIRVEQLGGINPFVRGRCNPIVRMAAPAEQEGPAGESQSAGEQADFEPVALDREANEKPINEPARECHLTTGCVDGRSAEYAAGESSSNGAARRGPIDRPDEESTYWTVMSPTFHMPNSDAGSDADTIEARSKYIRRDISRREYNILSNRGFVISYAGRGREGENHVLKE
jgi:hypothetical protein